MKIRPATKDDFTSFQEIMKVSIGLICTEAYGSETTAAWISDDNPAFHFNIPNMAFVAEEGHEIVAVGGWSLTDRVDLHPSGDSVIEKPTHARINAVYVKPGQDGRGLGRKMVTHLEQDIMSSGKVRDIYLWSTKNAIPFYQSMGYTPGTDQYPEVAPGYKVLVRYMWKTLNDKG